MRRLSLEEIQQTSLKVLLEIHNFCVENDIKYSLAYGTLLGAIRHKGFIPWDDDIDIVMTRPNYERFCSLFYSKNTILIKPGEDSFLNYSRVCEIVETTSVTLTPWTLREGIGVWIDVFPLDSVSDDKIKFSQQIQDLSKIHDELIKGRQLYSKFNLKFTFKQNILILLNKIRNRNINARECVNKIEKIVRTYPYGRTKHCSQLVCRGNKDKEFFTVDMFSHYITKEFEGYNFMVAQGWEEILKSNFGNYMELPPVGERKPHGGFAKFFWK